MNVWPATLPQRSLRDGFQQSMGDTRRMTPSDAGGGKTGRRLSFMPEPLRLAFEMTGDQRSIFEIFFEEALKKGTLPFILPAQGVVGTWIVKLGQSMPSWSVTKGVKWRVTLELVRLGRGAYGIEGAAQDARQGESYHGLRAQAANGDAPFAYAVTAGALPAGLVLDAATGQVLGAPTGNGSSTFTIRVTDAKNRQASRAFTILVRPPAFLFADGRIVEPAVTRATGGTYFGPDGIMRLAQPHELRWDYDPASGLGGAALIEPSVTNKLACPKHNPTGLGGINKAGDASSTLTLVDDTVALTASGLSAICTNGQVYKLDNSSGTGVAYAQLPGAYGNLNLHSLTAYVRGSGSGNLRDDASAGTVLVLGPTYRRATFVRAPTNTAHRVWIAAQPGAVVLFILPQLEEGTFATSAIIGDTSAAVTRAADSITPTFADFGFNPAEGAVIVDYEWLSATPPGGFATAFAFSQGPSFAEYISVRAGASAAFFEVSAAGGVGQAAMQTGGYGIPLRAAVGWKVNDFALALNGAPPLTDGDGFVPVGINQVVVGRAANGGRLMPGRIKRLEYLSRKPTNADLQARSAR